MRESITHATNSRHTYSDSFNAQSVSFPPPYHLPFNIPLLAQQKNLKHCVNFSRQSHLSTFRDRRFQDHKPVATDMDRHHSTGRYVRIAPAPPRDDRHASDDRTTRDEGRRGDQHDLSEVARGKRVQFDSEDDDDESTPRPSRSGFDWSPEKEAEARRDIRYIAEERYKMTGQVMTAAEEERLIQERRIIAQRNKRDHEIMIAQEQAQFKDEKRAQDQRAAQIYAQRAHVRTPSPREAERYKAEMRELCKDDYDRRAYNDQERERREDRQRERQPLPYRPSRR